jgi:voltage-gated potassium channel
MEKWKRKVYDLIRDDDENNIASNIFDGIIIFLIAINSILIILDTFDMPSSYQSVSSIIELISIIVFTIEYSLRIWTAPFIYPDKKPAKARLKYVFTFMAIIDLLSILPFYIPFIIPVDLRVLRLLRMARLLRLFKVNRYTDSLRTIGAVFKEKAAQLISSFFAIFILMIITSVLMCDVEKAAQPDKFDNAISGLWWAVATFTTVGYGDIYPITIPGKVLSGLVAILGIGLVAVPTGIISAGFVEQMENKKQEKNEKVSQTANSPADEIKKYKELLDAGAITECEYNTKKHQLLNI